MKHALILVDVQNDFLPGGALAVPFGNEVVPVANAVMPMFELVVATQDWHPADHRSFASQHVGRKVGDVIDLGGLPQVLWPDHCVQGTRGAELAAGLDTAGIRRTFQKGADPAVDSYSGFFDNGHRHATGLGEYLRAAHVETLTLLGLATDYCVKFTALDARKLGFHVRLLVDGVRGVNLRPADSDNALRELAAAGVELVRGEP